MFGRKKDKDKKNDEVEVIVPEPEQEQVDINEDMGEDLPQGEEEEPQQQQQPAAGKKKKQPAQPQKFILAKDEMDLFVALILQTKEYKEYQEHKVGEKFDDIIEGYKKTFKQA